MKGGQTIFPIGVIVAAAALAITAINVALHTGTALAGLEMILVASSLVAAGLAIFFLLGGKPSTPPEKHPVSHRSFLNTTLEGYWQIGPDGRTVEVNRALCRMLGYAENRASRFTRVSVPVPWWAPVARAAARSPWSPT